ncbi:glycoside hydrolase family 16 protein [soil metagenome]|jgi:beta-glucanase (GH16 family)
MKRAPLNFITGAGIVLALVTLTASCSKTASNVTPTVPDNKPVVTTPVTYTMVWADEFNGTAVDPANWNMETGSLGVNNEKEYYKAENATVTGGNLVITAKKESVGGFPYTSARMNTLGKVSVKYGRIEARIKMPLGAGLWPAFWMLGTNINTVSWPNCGELDIMEHVNADNIMYGTMHWNSGGGHAQYGLTTTTTPDAYHLYAIEWDANSIKWYVDDTLYLTGNIKDNINNTGAFQLPFFILLNFAVAGDFPGQTVDESKLPASMYVDYVRVYKAN